MEQDFETIIKYEGHIVNVDFQAELVYCRLLDITFTVSECYIPDSNKIQYPDEYEGEFPLSWFEDYKDPVPSPYLVGRGIGPYIGKHFYLIMGYQYDDTGNCFPVDYIYYPIIREWWHPDEIKEAKEEADEIFEWLNSSD